MKNIVKDLKSVLLPHIRKPGFNISVCDVQYLTAPGENYGSILLSLNILVEGPCGLDTIPAVVKAVPKNEFIKNFFMSSLTFKKELHFYSTVIPTLRRFQLDQGLDSSINFTVDFYGGRLSLESESPQADENALILMENLKAHGYRILERTTGFNFGTACLCIKNIALLHAVPLALKIKRPDIFEKQIKPYLEFTDLFTQSMSSEMRQDLKRDIVNLARENPKCVPYLAAIEQKIDFGRVHVSKEPFATITHNDLWVNNLMIKFDENGKPVDNKIIDFQFINYGSPGKDLLFFIFDSVESEVVRAQYDDLIHIYHQTFEMALKELQVDTAHYTYDKFVKELDYAAQNTFVIGQCLLMLRPIFSVKETMTDVENLRMDNILQYKQTTDVHKKKLYFLIEEFAKRRWI